MARMALAGLIALLACSSEEPADSRAGSLAAAWTGADTGKLSGPAVAEWCDSLDVLEVRAIRGDTGIALVLYPSDTLSRPGSVPSGSVPAGDYSVVPPERADSTRPAAAVALRWFAETSIRGFRGDSGSVVLDAAGPDSVYAGRFSAHLRAAGEGSRLRVIGSFKGLAITRALPGCAGGPADDPDEDGLSESDEDEDPDTDAEPE